MDATAILNRQSCIIIFMGAWGFDIFRSYGIGSCDDDEDDDDDDDDDYYYYFLFIPEEKWRDGQGVPLFNRTSSCSKPRFFYTLEL